MGTDERLEHLRALAEHLKECTSMGGVVPLDSSVVLDFCEEFQKLDLDLSEGCNLPNDWDNADGP